MSILDDIRVTLEKKITYHFYKQKNNAYCKTVYGLEQPMWLWTHRSNDCEAAEALKVSYLLHWLIDICPLSSSHSIAVVCPSSSFRKTILSLIGDRIFRGQLTFLSYSELLSDKSLEENQYSVVIHCFGISITDDNCQFFKSDGIKCLSRAIYAAKDIFILTCEASWAYAPSLRWKCPVWYQVISDIDKLESPTTRETPELSFGDLMSIPKIPSIIGPRIPICCPKHDREKTLATGNNPFDGFCSQKCFLPYQCGNNTHICLKQCHLGNSHRDCPFPCSKQLPCGHPCVMLCCEPCDCLEEKRVPNVCSHNVVTSFNSENQIGIQQTFSHVFHGRCVDSHLPCCVEVPTVCAQCLGDLTVRCSAIQGTGHTLENPVIECPDCKQRRRFIRTEVRHELVSEMTDKREETRAAVRANMKKYRKLTGGGIFQDGQRVYLNDINALRDPFLGDFSQTIEFEDIDGQSLAGIHGIVAASLVDPVDSVTEVKYLVRLVTGNYILAADFGLQAVGAICSSAGETPLLITGGRENGTCSTHSDNEKLFKSLKGSKAHLHQIVKDITVPADIFAKGLNETTLSIGDIVVTIQEEDVEMSEKHCLPFAKVIATFHYYEENIKDEPDSKRHRSEPKNTVSFAINEGKLLSSFDIPFSAPITALQPITTIGKDVIVTDATKQLLSPECYAYEPFILSAVKSKINPLVLGDSPVCILQDQITDAEVFCLLDVVNAPFKKFPTSNSHVMNGRMVSSLPTAMIVSKQFFFRNHRLSSRFPRRHHMTTTPTETPQHNNRPQCSVAIIPFIFISPDEEAQAEETLERDILSKLDEVADRRFKESCDKLAFQNDSERFKKEQKLPHPTDCMGEGTVVYSTPHPLRPIHEVNSLRARYAALDPPPEKYVVDMTIKKYELSLKFRNSKNQILNLSKIYADMRGNLLADIDSDRRHAESK